MDEPRRIVILGKTGSGKSSLANTIFREDFFKVNQSPASETKNCTKKSKPVNERQFTLVDTPGFFDTNISEDKIKPEILRCITECAPGLHAVLIVLKVEKYTKHEQAVIDTINEYFSEEVFKYAIVIFTHGDQLPKGQTIIEFVKGNESLSDLVKKCGDRCHVIDNKYWNKTGCFQRKEYQSNKFQVKEILKTLHKMVDEHNGGYYTNDMLQEVEQEIQQEEEQIRQSSTNMSKEEIRERARDNVFEKLLTRLAKMAAKVLLGALFGMIGGCFPFVSMNGEQATETDTLQEAAEMAPEADAGETNCKINGRSLLDDTVSESEV